MVEDFGKKMRAIREERGMTLEEMASYLGTTKQALSRYERGERTPKITVAAGFADVLGVPLEELIGVEAVQEEPPDRPKTPEARLLAKGVDQMPQEQREQLLNVFRAIYPQYAGYFEEKEREQNHDD